MNFHVPQSPLAQAECATFMRSSYHIVSPQNNAAVKGCVQNTIVFWNILTEHFLIDGKEIIEYVHEKDVNDMIMQLEKVDSAPGELSVMERYYSLTRRAKKYYPDFIESVERKHRRKEVNQLSSKKFNDLLSKHKIHLNQNGNLNRTDLIDEILNIEYPVENETLDTEYGFKILIPGNLIASIAFPSNLTWEKETKSNPSYPKVIIENGVLLPNSGPLCKQCIGPGSNNIVHLLWLYYGQLRSQQFINEMQCMQYLYFPRRGFSFSISDCILTNKEELKELQTKTLIEYQLILENKSSGKTKEEKEKELANVTNTFLTNSYQLLKFINKGCQNSGRIMSASKAKGSEGNLAQISCSIGQQSIEGQRSKFKLLNGTRSTPFDFPNDESPQAKGMGLEAFVDGMTIKSTIHHSSAGRHSLVDTAMKTSDVGYKQKKICKKTEDCIYHYDGSVRDANGCIIQFLFGGDGMSTRYVHGCDGLKFPFFINPRFLANLMNSEYEEKIFEIEQNNKGDLNYISKCGNKVKLTNGQLSDLTSRLLVGTPKIVTEITNMASYNISCILRKLLHGIRIYEDIVKEFCLRIYDMFYQAQEQNGTCVGLQAGLAISEPTTQQTLNTFHFCGQTAKDVTLGVPRLQELLSVSKKPPKPTSIVYLKDEKLKFMLEEKAKLKTSLNEEDKKRYNFLDRESAKRVALFGRKLTEVYMKSLITKEELLFNSNNKDTPFSKSGSSVGIIKYNKYKPLWWKKLYCNISEKVLFETSNDGKNSEDDDWILRIHLNVKLLFKYKLTLDKIVSILEEEACNKNAHIQCIASPLSEGIIEIYTNFSETQKRLNSKLKSNVTGISKFTIVRDITLPYVRNVLVSGITGILKTYPTKNRITDEWYLDVQGTNFGDLWAVNFVDTTRLYSDNIWEIYHNLGIEASRNHLITEMINVLSFDGTYINKKHFTILVDMMLKNGILTPASREGISKDAPILARALFEQCTHILTKSAIFAEGDNMNSNSSSVMFGTIGKFGTGTVKLAKGGTISLPTS